MISFMISCAPLSLSLSLCVCVCVCVCVIVVYLHSFFVIITPNHTYTSLHESDTHTSFVSLFLKLI